MRRWPRCGARAGADDAERPVRPGARVVVGTEAALHRVRAADAVAFLDFDSELLAPRFARRRGGAGAAGPRRARLVSAPTAPAPATGPRAGWWSRPASPDIPPGGRGLGRSRRAGRRGDRGAPGPRPSALQRHGGGVGRGGRRLRRRPCGPPRRRGWRCAGPSTARGRCALPTTGRCATCWRRCPARRGDCGWRSTRCGCLRPRRRRPAPGRAPVRWPACRAYAIRLYGDPVLRQRAAESRTSTGRSSSSPTTWSQTMYEAPGVGLAAPQVGVQKRMFVYDTGDGDGPVAVVNPVLVRGAAASGPYEEGCLSVPGLSWPIVRPKEVHLTGYDLDGNEISVEADEFLARVFQHEVDHLDGVLAGRAPRRGPAQGGQAHPPGARPRACPTPTSTGRALGRERARRPATPACSGAAPVARLVFLGSPDAAVAPARGARGGRPRRVPWWCQPRRHPPGRGHDSLRQPGQAGRPRSRARRSPTSSTT